MRRSATRTVAQRNRQSLASAVDSRTRSRTARGMVAPRSGHIIPTPNQTRARGNSEQKGERKRMLLEEWIGSMSWLEEVEVDIRRQRAIVFDKRDRSCFSRHKTTFEELITCSPSIARSAKKSVVESDRCCSWASSTCVLRRLYFKMLRFHNSTTIYSVFLLASNITYKYSRNEPQQPVDLN